MKMQKFLFLVFAMLVFAFATMANADDPFPVTIKHALGSTTIPAKPQRIVTLGWSGEDVVIALGKIPVAMTRYGFFPSGMFPWDEERLSGSLPQLFEGETDYEAIAALRPDLIVAVLSGVDEVAWRRLSAIAPTVVYRSGPWRADWKEQTDIVGRALGKHEEAEQLQKNTTAYLQALGATHPELHGKTFTFATYFRGSNSIVVYLPSDPRVAALSVLGLTVSPRVADFSKANPSKTSVSISLEEIQAIDADLLIMWFGDGARQAAEAQPLFQTLGAVERGGYVALDDPVSVWSTSALSVLSIPYGFPKFVPRLAEAARKLEQK
ncbi:iron ABC transporter substrate-binding protein [Agrobacterium rosae]|uniref:Iron ABC transporter substrate-binding protein n=2 Tax=Agrobacterium rosae TaxID=1972867 RepID=A0AAE5VME0_9HYPH|nr:iron-siderophore ABC transporter substrate-binding protein [Agrobacterium rosae]KAA3513849.1 iron-siderophore ABC transporter substrate-binding protein [Agrobacterium rosae]MBN7808223.1 iron-siderophore ABC transporter substrate-binding protein [Agrobacterium rosae]MCM2435678.1 iron-siderophore ABC transporter substrate-binding protein [Agrobacterium rosae]MQB50864.1 iron-siderophore ABC transporter substrate-binding protein [Agrobacterium rosae]